MKWEGIVGHGRQIEVLRQAVRQHRTSHAYMFLGPMGLGKSTVASVLGRALLCEADVVAPPCGGCRSCKADLAAHPDWFEVAPDGAAIKIHQVRALQRELVYRPAWAHRKVFCIDPADTMTEQAQNCLLKSLEEPPPYVSLILVAHHGSAMLPTVRSRAMQLRFGPVPGPEIGRALEALGMDPDAARLAAAVSFGRPAAALGADVEQLQERRKQAMEWTRTLREDPAAVWHVAEALDKEKAHAAAWIDLLMLWYRDVLLMASGAAALQTVVNQDALAEIEREADALQPHELAKGLGALLQLKENLSRNANFRLAVDVALIRLQRGLSR